MIFVTVGTQLPFDRLVRAVDGWAGATGRSDVFAQMGPSRWKPRHIECAEFLSAPECRERIEQCDAVIAHAGMGSILTALELGKPIVVMPRLASLHEHRNDHQLATARRFEAQGRIVVAFDEEQLVRKLDEIGEFAAADRISSRASPRLLHAIRHFVRTGERPVVPADRPVFVPRPAAMVVRSAPRTVVEPPVEVLAEALVG
jgi:UDP-N-acetylglucosamine transferase subunit ALG13